MSQFVHNNSTNKWKYIPKLFLYDTSNLERTEFIKKNFFLQEREYRKFDLNSPTVSKISGNKQKDCQFFFLNINIVYTTIYIN